MANSNQNEGGGKGAQKRRLSAIMFSDVKGFTSMMESDEVTAVGLVKFQREIVRKYIALHQGEERETIGDAFLVIFDSAVNAVRCAIDIQRDIWEHNQGQPPEKQVWLRIGIHLGDIIIEEGSIFGEGVNLAARVQPLAEPGGICITRQVFDQVKHHIEISVARLGVKDLKNVADVPDIFRIRISTTAPREPLTLKEHLREFTDSPLRVALFIGAALLVIGANAYWNFFAPRTSYARYVAFIRHAPHPRHEVGKSRARALSHYYELTRRGMHVVRLKEVAKPDVLPEDAQRAWEFQLAKKPKRDFPVHEYVYEGDGVKEEHVYDRYGVLQYKLIYDEGGRVATVHDRSGFVKTFENQIAGFGYEFDEIGRAAKMENRNAFGMPKDDSQGVASYRYKYDSYDLPTETGTFDSHGNPIENKDGVALTAFVYDKEGLPQKDVFLDRYGAVRESTRGIAMTERLFDGDGRVVLEKYVDRMGQPAADNEGACARKFAYDKHGRLSETTNLSCAGSPKATHLGYAIKRYEYEDDRIVKEKFFDEKSMPTTDNRGISAVHVDYDDTGRIAAVAFFGPDGGRVTNEEQIHSIRFSYDNFGRPVRRLYIGLDGNPAIASAGYADVRVQYDERGDAIEWAYFDTEGNLINRRDGYAVVRNEYDQFGYLISKAFFDKGNQPIFGREDACHRIQLKYDENGDLAETRCFDGEGKLTPGIKHCSISRYDYDSFGKLTRFECYLDEGKLVDEPNIPSVLAIKYDERGYTSEVRAFNAHDEPAERYQGAAIWKRISDNFGNQLEISTYDRNGRLIDNPKYKAAIFRREFDERGHELGAQAFDHDGRPTIGIWGFAEIRYSYDDRGHRTSEAYFNDRELPTRNWQGVHKYRTSYDDRGRISEIANLGEDGKPILSTDGMAFTRYAYDQWGWVTEIDYLGVDGQLIRNRRLGCASQKYTVDDRGNVLEIRRFDVDGDPCREKGCVAETVQEFDAKGRMVKQIFKDAAGNPTVDENGSSGYVNEYDIEGRILVQHVMGADGKDGVDKDGVHEYRLHYKPDTGNLWFITFADAEGKPARTKVGADLRAFVYDPVYTVRQRARVDATESGRIVSISCLDEAGNETSDTACIGREEAKAELDAIRPQIAGAQPAPAK